MVQCLSTTDTFQASSHSCEIVKAHNFVETTKDMLCNDMDHTVSSSVYGKSRAAKHIYIGISCQ